MASPKEKSAKTRGVQWFNLDADAWSHVINRLDILDVQNFMSTCQEWYKVSFELNKKRLTSGINA
jgi:hypothetical protein